MLHGGGTAVAKTSSSPLRMDSQMRCAARANLLARCIEEFAFLLTPPAISLMRASIDVVSEFDRFSSVLSDCQSVNMPLILWAAT
jgi:hypothetical protein